MLRIQLSDLNQTFREHRRDIGATFYTGGVSVIITNDEDLLQNRFADMMKIPFVQSTCSRRPRMFIRGS